ncbi:unnamed protein product [Dovyalis caffra]|uniref:Uncharacterized protein n=1 Tax=Dovyalis caffra TaxID=77055 RepID=A0AAV1QT16_9ROSI|nr:unnamed protein product [Dovyalis caffra]
MVCVNANPFTGHQFDIPGKCNRYCRRSREGDWMVIDHTIDWDLFTWIEDVAVFEGKAYVATGDARIGTLNLLDSQPHVRMLEDGMGAWGLGNQALFLGDGDKSCGLSNPGKRISEISDVVLAYGPGSSTCDCIPWMVELSLHQISWKTKGQVFLLWVHIFGSFQARLSINNVSFELSVRVYSYKWVCS